MSWDDEYAEWVRARSEPSERQIIDWAEHNAHADQLDWEGEGLPPDEIDDPDRIAGNAHDVAEVEVFGFEAVAEARGYVRPPLPSDGLATAVQSAEDPHKWPLCTNCGQRESVMGASNFITGEQVWLCGPCGNARLLEEMRNPPPSPFAAQHAYDAAVERGDICTDSPTCRCPRCQPGEPPDDDRYPDERAYAREPYEGASDPGPVPEEPPKVRASVVELCELLLEHLRTADSSTRSWKTRRHITEASNIAEAIRKWAADPATD